MLTQPPALLNPEFLYRRTLTYVHQCNVLLQLLGTCSQTSYRGFAPRPHSGTSVPTFPYSPPLENYGIRPRALNRRQILRPLRAGQCSPNFWTRTATGRAFQPLCIFHGFFVIMLWSAALFKRVHCFGMHVTYCCFDGLAYCSYVLL